jgi:hypothetical protein
MGLPDVSDERIEFLLDTLRYHLGGFVNHMIMRDEFISLLTDLKRLRDKPLHCPGCDGDHM